MIFSKLAMAAGSSSKIWSASFRRYRTKPSRTSEFSDSMGTKRWAISDALSVELCNRSSRNVPRIRMRAVSAPMLHMTFVESFIASILRVVEMFREPVTIFSYDAIP